MRFSALFAIIAWGMFAETGLAARGAQVVPASPVIAVSPDGDTYARVNSDNVVEIRSFAQPAAADPLSTIKTGGDHLTALTFSSDGFYLAGATDNREISIWQVANGERISHLFEPSDTHPELKRVSHIAALAFNPSGNELALVDDGFSWLERFTGPSISDLHYRGGALDAAITKSPLFSIAADGHGGWVGGNAVGAFYFYDAALKQTGFTASKIAGAIRSLSVSPDTLLLASAGDDRQVKLWFFPGPDAASSSRFSILKELAVPASVLAVVFRGDQKGLMFADVSSKISLSDLPSTTSLIASAANLGGTTSIATKVSTASAAVPGATAPVTGAAAQVIPPPITENTPPPVAPVVVTPPAATAPPGKSASPPATEKPTPPSEKPAQPSAGTKNAEKPALEQRSYKTAALPPPPVKNMTASLVFVKSLIGHSEYVNSVAFSADGHTIASGSRDDTVRLWDVSTGAPLKILAKHRGYVSCVAFSPENGLLASGGWDNHIKLFDLPSGNPKDEGEKLNKHTSYVLSIAFSPDSKLLADGSNDKTARVFSFAKGTSTATAVMPEAIAAVAFSPDGSLIAGGCLDGNVYIWEANSLKLLHKLIGIAADPVFCVTFLNDKTIAAGGRGGNLRVWRLDTAKPIATVSAGAKDIFALAYNQGTNLLASGGTDQIIRLWSAQQFEQAAKNITPIATGKEHTNTVRAIAFSPDGKMLASGSWDATIALWDVSETPVPSGGTAMVRSGSL